MPPTRAWSDRLASRWRLVTLGILAASLLIRLIYGLEIRRSPIPELWRSPETDMSFFVAWAKLIAAGDWLTDQPLHPYFSWQHPIGTLAEWNQWYGGKTLHQAPLYPYLMALWFRLGGSGPWGLLLVQALGSAVTAVLIASIGRRLFNPTAGLLAGLMAAAYGPLLFYDFIALRTSLTVLTAALAIWLLIRADGDRRVRWWIAAGAVIGLGFLLRPNAALLLVLALATAVVLSWGRWRDLASAGLGLAGGFAVCLIPLVARNVCVGAPPLSVSAVGASTLYLANAAGAPGTGWGITPTFPEAMRRTGGRFGPLAREAVASHVSITRLVGLLATKLSACGHYFERSNSANVYYAQRFSRSLRWATVPYWLILTLAVPGLVVTWSDRRRLIWLYVAVLAPLLTILLFYQTGRFRLPMIVGLIPLAAATIEWMLARRGNLAAAVPLTIVLAVAVRWPSDADPPYVQPRDFSAAAAVLSGLGRDAAAIVEAHESVSRFPRDLHCRVHLIDALHRAGRLDEAIQACDQALRDLPDKLTIRTHRALIDLDRGRPDRAIAAFRAVLRSNPNAVPAMAGMARALAAPGPAQDLRDARQWAERAVRIAPSHARAYQTYAEVLVASGMEDRAIAVLDAGLSHLARTDPDHDDLRRRRQALCPPGQSR